MGREKRKGDTSIPENLEAMLSAAQRSVLSGIEYLEWEPRFLRQPLFQAPVLVLQSTNDKSIGIMNEDGSISIQSDIREHDQESQAIAPPPNNLHYY